MNKKLTTILVCIALAIINGGRIYAEEFKLIPMDKQTPVEKPTKKRYQAIKNKGIQIDIASNTVQMESELPVQKRTFYAQEYYDAQSNDPTVVNLSPNGFKVLETMEKRLYRKTFNGEKTLTRIERLEENLLRKEPQNDPENLAQRIDALKLASSRRALSGTSIPPSMSRAFMQRDLQSMEPVNNDDDVGLIDGLIKVLHPDTYNNIKATYKMREKNSPLYYF